MSLFNLLPQDVLTDLKTAQESLVVLQELGEELKSQVEASAAAAIQSDHLSLNQNLSTLEMALRKQQAALQVHRQCLQSSNVIILWSLKTHRVAKSAWEKRVVLPVNQLVLDFSESQS